MCPKVNLGVKEQKWQVDDSPKPVTVEAACVAVDGDLISEFLSQDTKEHICVVGFIKCSLDLHKSKIG